MSTEQVDRTVRVEVENVGGIDETSVTFSPGSTLLVGRNATNRTSFLQALMAGLGSDRASLKGDADSGSVELEVGGETYTRTLSRREGAVVTGGEPYLDDAETADLFAFLLEDNEARRAVARADDLRELIMQPVDVDSLRRQIASLREERATVESDIERIDGLKGELPSLESKRQDLRAEIAEARAELSDIEADIEETDRSLEESRGEQSGFEAELDELKSKRSTLEDIRFELETEAETLTALRREQTELESTLASLPEAPDKRLDEIDVELEALRETEQQLTSAANEVQNIIAFNEARLEEAGNVIETDASDVTGQLLDDDTITCWTCGSEVRAEAVEATVDELQETSERYVSEMNEVGDEISELRERRSELESTRTERRNAEQRLGEVDTEIETTQAAIERLRERRAELTEDIESLESGIDSREDADRSRVLDLHKEANELEYALGRLETDLEEVDGRIEAVETEIETLPEKTARRDDIRDEITELRTRINRLERDAVEAFNEHMAALLDTLEYENIERIWTERVEQDAQEGSRTATRNTFELHVVRTTESGTAYEDTVDHLSESEREITGLIFALSGYLAHDLGDVMPFMILDSLEAIDAARIATLVEYLADVAPYLVVALLPEDADALPDEYERVTEI